MEDKSKNAGLDTSSDKWMYPTLPANIAYGPLSTLVPLYILELGGGILDVSYAVTFSSLATVIAIFMWGHATDLLNKRKIFIVFTYLSSTILLIGFLFTKSVTGVILLYGALAFVSSASATPLNLLVMETSTEDKWPRKFSMLQMITSAGITIGFVIASIVTGFASLKSLIIVLSAVSLISSLMALWMISEPKKIHRRVSVMDDINSFISRHISIPTVMIRVPHTGDIKKMFRFKGIMGMEREFLIVFYIISFVFYFGSSIFNTMYPVGLHEAGLSKSYIFVVMLFAMIVQTLVFYYYDYFATGSTRRFVAYGSLFVRGAAYMMIGALFLPLLGNVFGLGNLLFFCLASGVAYSIYYTTSYTIFFNTITGRSRGSTVGVYGSLAGLGTFGGALAAGLIAVKYGFSATFITAGVFMILCAVLFRLLPKVS